MKFLSKKLISVFTFAAAGLLGMGNVSAAANPAQALFDANQNNFKSDFYNQNVVSINSSFLSRNLSDEEAVESLFVGLFYAIKSSSEKEHELGTEAKIACLMKGIEESLVKNLEIAFLSKKLATTQKVMEVVITKGFAGNRVAGVIRDLTENRKIRDLVVAWGEFHADKLGRFFDLARAAEVETERAAFEADRKAKAGATAKFLGVLGGLFGWKKNAEAPKPEAPKPAPAEEVVKEAEAPAEEAEAPAEEAEEAEAPAEEAEERSWFDMANESINTGDFDLPTAQEIAKAAWIQKQQDAKSISMEQVLELKEKLSDKASKLKMQFLGWLGYIAQLPEDKVALAAIAQTQQLEALFAQIGLI